MKLLILGAGMYVTGRHFTDAGTVLTSAIQVLAKEKQNEITVCATSPYNSVIVDDAAERIQEALGLSINVNYISYDGTTESLAKIVRERAINVAIVATPDHLHFEQVKTLLELGIHCLCVKPLVPTVKQHSILTALADKNFLLGVIEFHKRWDESNLLAKKYISDQKLGTIHNISVNYSQRLMIPCKIFEGWVRHTNIFQYLGIHYVDLILWLTESKPLRLCALGTHGILNDRGIDTWDSVHVWLVLRRQHGEEFLSQFNLSWIDSDSSPALSNQHFSILGSEGRLEIDQSNRGISATLVNQPMQHLNPWFSEILPSPDGRSEMQGYGFKSIAQFLKDTRQIIDYKENASSFIGRRPTFHDCIASTQVIEAVNHCLKDSINDFIDL